MSRKWTRSELRGLLQGDRKALETWIREQADFLYTWLIGAYGLSSSDAGRLVSAVFSAALEEIDRFRLHDGSMFRWLQSLARERIETQLPAAAQSVQPREPWTPEDLAPARALVQIAEKPFDETWIERPICADLLRAALSDLDEDDRNVLLARYHSFSSGAGLSVSTGLSPEEAQNRLVRARHELRLGLYREVRKGCPSLEPLSPSVCLEVFEANLEKLFHTLDPCLHLPEETRSKLIQSLSRDAARIGIGRRHELMQRRIIAFAAGAAAVAVLLVIGVVLTAQRYRRSQILPATAVRTPSPQPSPKAVEKVPVSTKRPAEMDRGQMEQQLLLVFRYGTEQDIPALLEILRTGHYSAQLVAAHFLGQYGDASVINPLQNAAEHWYPSEREENPFLKAIDAIETRLREQASEEVETPEEPETPGVLPVATEPNLPPAAATVPDANSLDHLPSAPDMTADPNEAAVDLPAEAEAAEGELSAEFYEEFQAGESFSADPNDLNLLETLEPVSADGQL